MRCFSCTKRTGNREIDIEICAKCQDVQKIDLVELLLERDPVYLSESTRYKAGRAPKLAPDECRAIYAAHEEGVSMGKLAAKYGVSKGTIFNVIQKEKSPEPNE